MPLFITQDRSASAYISAGLAKDKDRYAAASRACEQAGGKLVSFYFKSRRAVDSFNRLSPLAALMVALLLAGFIPLTSAMAQDSSPYVVGHWRLNDSFQDFTPSAPITTDNTDFVFLNQQI